MSVSMEAKLSHIKAFPCFKQFDAGQYDELHALMKEITYQQNEIIVKEHDLIDAVYIILTGQAEVTREVKKRKRTKQLPIATLHEGEAIGLNDTGFYSTTGKRTATVTALSDMLLLRLDIKDLYAFLKKHHLEFCMYTAAEQMLRMQLIKQCLPFNKLSHARLQWLTDRIEEIKLPANTIIFKEGDKGDKCYLIRSGKIEVTINEEGVERQLAILTSPALFGEATFITHAPRNATARVVEEAELLTLDHAYLTELIASENEVANTVMTLMLDRSRPIRNPAVTTHQRTAADGQSVIILKNPGNGSYFKLADEGYYIWNNLDGKHTLQDITLGLAEEYNLFAPDIVAGLISKLNRDNFIKCVDIEASINKSSQPLWIRLILHIQTIMSLHYAIKRPDNWITKTYNKYIWVLFTSVGKILTSLFIIFGFIGLYLTTDQSLSFFHQHKMGLLMVIMIYPFNAIGLILHELAHAYAVKAAGREVHHMGISWSFSGPIAFTDTSDMWLSSRRARIAVNFAGVYADAFFCSICVALIFIIHQPYIQAFLWMYAIYAYVEAFRELSPLQELDGYYILMDWVEKNHLRQRAVTWLVNKFPTCVRHPSLFKENRAELYYWVACFVYLVLVCIITLILQMFFLEIMGVKNVNPYLSLILPIAIVIISVIGIVAEIKYQAEE